MDLNEAIETLKNAGLLAETRRIGMPRQVFNADDLGDEPTATETVLDVLHGSILTNKKAREIVANYFKELLDTDDVQVYNGFYSQKVIDHMTYEPLGDRQEKGSFLKVNGQTYLIHPNALYWGVKNDMSFEKLIKTGKLEPKKDY